MIAMLCTGSRLFFLLIFSSILFPCTLGGSESNFLLSKHHQFQGENEHNAVHSWGTKRILAESPNCQPSSLILAANRTHRKDPLNDYNKYSGGCNISEPHYWAVNRQVDVILRSPTSRT
ncbi:uncharacterized protein LOC132605092 [Lycium barbarum]|uniref:uncharacterized protein LOC132605092 n=1 Tax=Lycium barbarum TaxID=112863 RepID=UPI00293E5FF9|nr:uncharacterized protein LOC132605092 [Lycium barbarum]